MPLEQLSQLQALQEVADQRGGTDFQGLQRSLLPGGGHQSLRDKAAGVEAVMAAAAQVAMAQGTTKKSWADWRRAGAACPGFFSTRQECGRPTPALIDC